MEFLPSYDEFLILINMTEKLEDNINLFYSNIYPNRNDLH